MGNSLRGPQHGNKAPYVMRLERVCQLIELDGRFPAIEFNPCSDAGEIRNRLLTQIGLRIRENGVITLVLPGSLNITAFGLTLANYKKVWRCWQNGVPTEAQRRAVRWG